MHPVIPGSAARAEPRGQSLGGRGGAPKGERARSMGSRRPRSSPVKRGRAEQRRAPHRQCGSRSEALIGAPPPFFLGEELEMAWCGKTRMRTHRENGFAYSPQGSMNEGEGHPHRQAKLSRPADTRRVARCSVPQARFLDLARAMRPAGLVPVLRQQAMPQDANVLRRRPAGLPSKALAPQDGEAQDPAPGMVPTRCS